MRLEKHRDLLKMASAAICVFLFFWAVQIYFNNKEDAEAKRVSDFCRALAKGKGDEFFNYCSDKAFETFYPYKG